MNILSHPARDSDDQIDAAADDRNEKDEEAFFEVWFQLYRVKQWKKSRPERAHEPPSEAFCMGLRGNFLTGWMARASLHVTPGNTFSEHGK